tara:strand:- start:25681 stop:27711 length:2031 start_codon:yes stop_codon:yes gene_type:complete
MKRYNKGGDKKSIMFLDQNKNKNQKVNLNLNNFRNVKNPDLMNALTIGGATFLGSSGIGSINTATKQKKGKKSVYDQYIQDQGGQSFIDRCSTGDCPNMPYYNPDQKWFYNAADRAGDMYENLGYHTGSASAGTSNDFSAYRAVKQGEKEGTILSKEDLNKKYMQNISKGLKQGVITGGASYLLNKALDNTKFGRRLQNKLGMDINLGIYKQDGGFKEAFREARNAGKETFTWSGKSYHTRTKEEEKKKDYSLHELFEKQGGMPDGSVSFPYRGNKGRNVYIEESQNPDGTLKIVKPNKKQNGGVKKYATAGMYDANVIPGSMNSTTNIVMQESDPSILLQNQQGLQGKVDELQRKGSEISTEISEMEANQEAEVNAAANKVNSKGDAAVGAVQKGMDFAKKQGWFKNMGTAAPTNINMPSLSAGSLSTPSFTPTSQLLSGTPGITPPSALSSGLNVPTLGGGVGGGGTFGSASLGADKLGASLGSGALQNLGTEAASKWAGFGKQGMEFGKWAQSGTKMGALGAKAGKFLTSGAGLGTVASLAGSGISKLSDDNDATKSNVGEYSGSILSGAGTGASIGSVIPGVGTAIGAAAGALYGAGKQFFGTRAAQKKDNLIKAQKRAKIQEYNETLDDQMGSQLARARAGEMEQKTYSGYDLGRNVTYGLGGLKMPRYGY